MLLFMNPDFSFLSSGVVPTDGNEGVNDPEMGLLDFQK